MGLLVGRAWLLVAAAALALLGACAPGDGEPGGSETVQDGVWTGVATEGFASSVAPLGDGFVASQDMGGRSQVLVSPDGRDWTVAETGAVAPGEQVSWMDGGTFGAVGEVLGGELPEVIVTTDGETFVRADPLGDLGFYDVGIPGMAWGPAGILVVLSRGGEPVGAVASQDGRSWVRAALPADLVDIVNPDSSPVAAGRSGYLILGVPESEGNPGIRAWSSPDARAWTPEIISEEFIAAVGNPVTWRGGYLTWGDTADDPTDESTGFTRQLWASPGDGTWTDLEVAGYEASVGETPVAGSELGVLAVSWHEDLTDLDVLFSTDLDSWRVWTMREAFGTDDPAEAFWGESAVGRTTVVVPVAGDLRVGRP